MALLGPRTIIETDITLSCPCVTQRGVGLVRGNANVSNGLILGASASAAPLAEMPGSGVALGDSAGNAVLVSNPSGCQFAGVLLGDVVYIDETHFHRNWQQDVQVPGERVNLLKKGRLTTNMIIGTPTDGQTAYLGLSGNFTPTLSATGGLAATPKAGQFVGSPDANGYQTIDFNLPN